MRTYLISLASMFPGVLIRKYVNMSQSKVTCPRFVSLMTALILSGCGGGGGGGGGSPAPPPPPAVIYSSPVTSVSPPNYTLADNTTIATQLNTARQATGSGLLAQNTSLDQAALSHTNFLVNNQLVGNYSYLTTIVDGVLGAHYENSALPGYTGALPQDRATAAGYKGAVTELLAFGDSSGASCLDSFEDSVVHLGELISSFVDIGIEFNAGNGTGSVCAIELGINSTTLGQLPTAGTVVTFPYDGQTGVPAVFYNLAESPVIAPDLTIAGHPIMVSLYTMATQTLSGSDIVIQGFTLTPENGATVPVRIYANTGVTSTGTTVLVDDSIPFTGEVVLLPTMPLISGTVYNVSFAAKVKGATVSKSWSFTTG